MGSDCCRLLRIFLREISIHAPRVGSDSIGSVTLPVAPISIHAPRVGSDHRLRMQTDMHLHFNPRSPRGERPQLEDMVAREFTFQSTLPAWGATLYIFVIVQYPQDFNPRSPRGERR